MKKNNQGFTLVELIVVIAILGILAAVAIPAYSGYISKAREASDLTQLDAIKTAAVFAAVDADNDATVGYIKVTVTANGDVSKIEVGEDSSDTSLDDVTDSAKVYLGNTLPTLASDKFKSGAEWDGSKWDS